MCTTLPPKHLIRCYFVYVSMPFSHILIIAWISRVDVVACETPTESVMSVKRTLVFVENSVYNML